MTSCHSSQSDASKIQQTDAFKDLEDDVQNLIDKIAQGCTELEDLIRTEHGTAREAIFQEAATTQRVLTDRLTAESQARDTDAEAKAAFNSFFGSLKFPEMDQRYNSLTNWSQTTFQSVFNSYKDISTKDEESQNTSKNAGGLEPGRRSRENEIGQTWATLVDWLQSSDSLFAIRGKPGSGKSTLVKFVVDSKNTKQLLLRWKPDATILSHFFWKIGSSPQNSIKGLLCTLVHQSLAKQRDKVDQIRDRFPHLASHSSYHDWSTEDLKAVLYSILDGNTSAVCIFIDGLDEIGDHDGLTKLTQVIEEILQFPNTKVCISSRPETVVMNWLNRTKAPSLLLEDLTRPDMNAFVRKELKPALARSAISENLERNLTSSLVSKAQGVFLWLHLATGSIVARIQNEDPEDMLVARLNDMPGELTQLYANIWQKLNEDNPVYQKTAARFFSYALQNNKQGFIPMFPEAGYPSGYPEVWMPTLFQIACAESIETAGTLLASDNPISRAKVLQLCETTTATIQTRCAGLLRVQPPSDHQSIQYVVLANGCSLSESTESVKAAEKALFSSVAFTHRTAHDFLTDTEAGRDILNFGALSERTLKIRLLKGLLCIFRFLCSEYGVMCRGGGIISNAINLFKSAGNEEKKEAEELLRTLQRLYDEKAIGDEPKWQPQTPFLSHLTDYPELDDLVISTVARVSSSTLATDLLRDAWDPDLSLYYNRGRSPSAKLAKALVSLGADPHAYGLNCARRMGCMEPFARQGSAFSNLLSAGLKTVDDGEYLDGASAREMLKVALSMATTCPDLKTTTLLHVGINASGKASLWNLTCLKTPLSFGNLSLVFEVDFKFLLLQLLSGLATGSDIEGLDSSSYDDLLPRLENPVAKLRLIFSRGENPKPPLCHRILSQLSSTAEISAITDCVFPPSPDLGRDAQQVSASEKIDSIYRHLAGLSSDPGVELVDVESAMTSLARERIGFCTLLEAGVIPPLSFIDFWDEHVSSYPFPLTITQLRAKVTEVSRAKMAERASADSSS